MIETWEKMIDLKNINNFKDMSVDVEFLIEDAVRDSL